MKKSIFSIRQNRLYLKIVSEKVWKADSKPPGENHVFYVKIKWLLVPIKILESGLKYLS